MPYPRLLLSLRPRFSRLHIPLGFLAFLTAASAMETIVEPALLAEEQEVTVRETLHFAELPDLPHAIADAFAGTHADTLIVAGGTGASERDVLILEADASEWRKVGELEHTATEGASLSTNDGLLLIGGLRDGVLSDAVTQLSWSDGALQQKHLPPLPIALKGASAAMLGKKLYVAGGQDASGALLHTFFAYDTSVENPQWSPLPAWPGSALSGATLAASLDMLFLVGGEAQGELQRAVFRYNPNTGWAELAELANWPRNASKVPFGHSHIFFIGGVAADGRPNQEVLAYHTITNTLTPSAEFPSKLAPETFAAKWKNTVVLFNEEHVLTIEPVAVETGYNWLDHSVVALYMVAMVYMGFFFSKREKSSGDFFRGGNRIPWWASGMSLFATGSSAISLMAMPGKAFSSDWSYFTIGLYAVMVLPISIFFLAPLVRRLKIATANEYLEKRFGLSVRLFASVIFMFTQVAGRMASVMLLPAIALSAITGMSIITCILIMGIVTTIYTYFGGLEAVVWTDTIQGFVMAASVGGCLILALTQLDMGPLEMWTTATEAGKFEMFDFSWDITYPTALIFFMSTAIGTMGAIGDQNFVQRVQCTPDMRQTKLAVATQLAVAIPINLLLFALGTALFLFYKSNPGELDPLMKTDGIYPFFVAQQLPPGLSGLVVAALFAATMSTISSSICSVSDLGVQDFYRRFNKNATDHSALILARILTAVVGIAGMTAAILLSKAQMTSVWDLATLVIGLIGSGVVGLFMLGLFTKRANEAGAVAGMVIGLAVILYLRQTSTITFWLYGLIGSGVTFTTGYLASLLLPGKPRPLAGLTVYTLPSRSSDE